MKVKDFLKQFGITNVPPAQTLGDSYFVIEDASLLTYRPAYLGECIGHQRGDTFIPSIDFLQWVGHQAKKKITVDEKGEWLFTRGWNLPGKYVTTHTNPERGDLVVIMNQHNECLGYGQLIEDIASTKTILKRRFDIGDILRRDRQSRKP